MKNRRLKIIAGIVLIVVAAVAISLAVYNGYVGPFRDSGTHAPAAIEPTPQLHPQPVIDPYSMRATGEGALEEKTAEELRLELREKIARQRREADALEARKQQAFRQWWEPPRWCNEASTMKMLVQCSKLRRLKREEFDKLIAAGKVTLPPK